MELREEIKRGSLTSRGSQEKIMVKPEIKKEKVGILALRPVNRMKKKKKLIEWVRGWKGK